MTPFGWAVFVPGAESYRAMELELKTVPFQLETVKAAGDGWEFSGYASTYGNVDEGGDVVVRGAFADSLKARPKPKLLWQHDMREPIGVPAQLTSDEHGLKGTWRLSKTARGSDAYELLKDGAIDSLSIGYIPSQAEYRDDGVRLLKSVDLLEVSLVSLPMNEQALVTTVKAAFAHRPLEAILRQEAERARLVAEEVKALYLRRGADKPPRLPNDATREAEATYRAEAKALWDEVDVLAATGAQARAAHGLTLKLRLMRTRSRLREQGILDRAAV